MMNGFLLKYENIVPQLLLILYGILRVIVVFIACELGRRMIDVFDGIELTIEQFDWYLFPIKMQRMLPAIIAVAQRSVSMQCFGSIICTRDVFKNVRFSKKIKRRLNFYLCS